MGLLYGAFPRYYDIHLSAETRLSREHPVQDYLTFNANIYPLAKDALVDDATRKPSTIELRVANVCHAYVDCVTSASSESTCLRRRRRIAAAIQTEVIGVKCQRNSPGNYN